MEGFRIATWLIEPRLNTVSRNGATTRLEPKVMEVLVCLAQRAGEPVSKEELLQTVWPDTFVTDDGLKRSISELRRVFEDDARDPHVIQTIPKRGYRLVVPVQPVNGSREIKLSAQPTLGATPLPARAEHRPSKLSWRLAVLSTAAVVVVAVVMFWAFLPDRVPVVEGVTQLLRARFASRGAGPIKERQLTTNSSENPVTSAEISPDGRYLLYSDARGVHLKLIESGEITNIVLPVDREGRELQWMVAAWFPDGTHFLLNAASTITAEGIWKFSLIGGSPRQLTATGAAWSISASGTQIAFSEKAIARGGFQDIWVMKADGEEPRRIAEFNTDTFIDNLVWSPAGKWLVYGEMQMGPDKTKLKIEARDISTNETRLVANLGTDVFPSLLWLSDGRLLFTQRGDAEAFSCDIWAMSLNEKTGHPENNSTKLTNWTGLCGYSMSATSSPAKLLILKGTLQSATLVAEIGTNGLAVRGPHRLTVSDSLDVPSAWTADSREVLFSSSRNGHEQTFRQALDSDNAELIPFDFPSEQLCCASPDGNWILIFTTPDRSVPTAELRRVPIHGGPSEPVLTARISMNNIARCAVAPPTLCALAERTPDNKQLIFTAFDPMKGRGSELLRVDTSPDAIYSWSISLDGTKIAVMNPKEAKVHVFHLDRKPEEEIVPKGVTLGDALDWSADGKGLFIDYATKRGMALGYLDLRGNTHLVWEETALQGAQGITAPWGIPSRDGKHLAINGTYPSANAWLLENF